MAYKMYMINEFFLNVLRNFVIENVKIIIFI